MWFLNFIGVCFCILLGLGVLFIIGMFIFYVIRAIQVVKDGGDFEDIFD